jgi:hypothetical protein
MGTWFGFIGCPNIVSATVVNTEIKFCVGKTSPTMPNLNWLHCKLLFHYYLLADPTDVLSNPNFSKLVCDDDLFSSIKFEITMNLKVFYLHFDCKIDVQVNNPTAK